MKLTSTSLACLFASTALASDYSLPSRVAYHELAAPPIGETAFVNYSEYPRLSADASQIIYRVFSNNVLYVHAVGFDGANDRVVDALTNGGYRAYVLNATGTRQANLDSFTLRTGTTAPGMGAQRLAVFDPRFNSPALSDDGNKVFFCVAADTSTFPDATPLDRGLYELGADGTGRRLITGLDAVATTLGVPADDNLRFQLAAASGDAQQFALLVSLSLYVQTNAILGVNRDGGGLHVIGLVGTHVADLAISRDGGTVAWAEYGGPVRVAEFSGANARTLVPAADVPVVPLTLTANGSHLMESSGRIYRTDGLGLRTVLYNTWSVQDPVLTAGTVAQLSPGGQRGVFVGGRRLYGNQVCTFEFDPAAGGAAPVITNPAVSPGYVRSGGASFATATATASFTGTNRGAGVVSYRDGRLDGTFYLSLPLYDNGTTGDPVAGDGQYANNTLQCFYPDQHLLGPRTLRLHAESTDANGLRHAATLDFATFFVVSNTPSGGGPVVFPNPTTSTNGGRRVITLSGTGFAPDRTNVVVTLNGYPLEVLAVSTNEIQTELPAWFPDGVYAVRVWSDGQTSNVVRYRSPGLSRPVIQPLGPPVGNSVPLTWTAYTRALYTVLGSTNLVNWISLTNGVPGAEPTAEATVDASSLDRSPRFFRVLEEEGVLE